MNTKKTSILFSVLLTGIISISEVNAQTTTSKKRIGFESQFKTTSRLEIITKKIKLK